MTAWEAWEPRLLQWSAFAQALGAHEPQRGIQATEVGVAESKKSKRVHRGSLFVLRPEKLHQAGDGAISRGEPNFSDRDFAAEGAFEFSQATGK